MKVLAINGSPRKRWNTATLLEKSLEGAASKGAETELVHLYEHTYKGCTSCFSCKQKDGKSYGRCAMKDDLTEILAKVEQADALLLGSPVYFGRMTGEMRSFIERLLYPYLKYSDPWESLFPRKIPTAIIYTMNIPEEDFKKMQMDLVLGMNEAVLNMIFGYCETQYCYDTLQFPDYNKVVYARRDPAAKAQRHEEVFPKDCQQAYKLGVRLTQGAE